MNKEHKPMTAPEIAVICFYAAIALASLYFASKAINTEPRLACSIAEISPDFSHQDRERCRTIRGHKL
jgi:uroporphyrinogen-III synthase